MNHVVSILIVSNDHAIIVNVKSLGANGARDIEREKVAAAIDETKNWVAVNLGLSNNVPKIVDAPE